MGFFTSFRMTENLNYKFKTLDSRLRGNDREGGITKGCGMIERIGQGVGLGHVIG